MRLKSINAYAVFATTIFLSAFLLFQIQPIAGKLLLPWFGGSSSVWATSMLFFTSVLFLGYLYAYLITRRSVEVQIRIHLAAIALGGIAALTSLFGWGSLFPSLVWTIGSHAAPAAKTLLALFSGVGIPYFLLSTTGPLLQHWYGVSAQKEPYKLYAISNAGSLLALASYPFFIEPYTRLSGQETVWMILFLVFLGLLGLISLRFVRSAGASSIREDASPMPISRTGLWIAYAALPAFLLIATTTEITQVIAPVPLLWIVPLSLYLLSFIVAFTGFRGGFFVPIAVFASACAAWWFIDVSYDSIKWKVIADLALLFFTALHAHSHLYRLRPSTASSALFYVFISFGGMLGVLLASVVAPLVFNDYYEFQIGLAIAAAIALHISPAPAFFARPSSYAFFLKIAGISFALTLIAASTYVYFKDREQDYFMVSRNFYGTVKVYDNEYFRSLRHGATLHGLQLRDPAEALTPTAYYTPESGLGRAFMHTRIKNADHRASVGILGLGAGMIAAYCLPGDRFVYYEVDSRIEEIAREQFTYLSHCPQAEVRDGDGRILLDEEYREGKLGGYDIVAADAFNDDTVPVHLITKEAIARYVSHLKDDSGIVAMHISNRYLDLLPVLMSIAQEEGLSLLNVYLEDYRRFPASASHWVLLSPSPETFNADIFKGAASPLSEKKAIAWTDDYSELISVLDIW
ncbi:MAG: fused MFS/spermidine synthase [Patescibacteria group bacterium]